MNDNYGLSNATTALVVRTPSLPTLSCINCLGASKIRSWVTKINRISRVTTPSPIYLNK